MAKSEKAVDVVSHGKRIGMWRDQSQSTKPKDSSQTSESAYRDYVESINRSHDREIERSLRLAY